MEFNPRPCAYIWFPGTEIPKWFTFQGMGSYVSLKLPLGSFNPKIVSFAMCAIVDFQNYHDKGQGLVVGCDCKIRSNDGTVLLYHGTLRGWYYSNGPYSIGSYHIFMGYDFHTCFLNLVDTEYDQNYEVSIHFYVEDLNNKRIDCCEVRKYGVYLLYSHEYNIPLTVADKEGQKCKIYSEREMPKEVGMLNDAKEKLPCNNPVVVADEEELKPKKLCPQELEKKSDEIEVQEKLHILNDAKEEL